MIKFYRIYSYVMLGIASIYILLIIWFFFTGKSELSLLEDYFIALFIILCIFINANFLNRTKDLVLKSDHQFEVIKSEEIKAKIGLQKINLKTLLYANFTLGVIISVFMVISLLIDPLSDLQDDIGRLISILLILGYGLIQVKYSLIVKKRL